MKSRFACWRYSSILTVLADSHRSATVHQSDQLRRRLRHDHFKLHKVPVQSPSWAIPAALEWDDPTLAPVDQQEWEDGRILSKTWLVHTDNIYYLQQ